MQAFKNILIPTDFSQAAWNAVQLGAKMAIAGETEVTLLHVFPSSAKFDSRKGELDIQDLNFIDDLKSKMDFFCNDLRKQHKVSFKSIILGGAVEEEICQYLQDNVFDLVIIGINSNGMDNEPGSHTTGIIANSTAPVLVVPNEIVNQKTLVA